MITRRDFLKASVLTGGALIFPMASISRYAHAEAPYVPPVSPLLTKYIDSLPIPGLAVPNLNAATGFYELALSMSNASYSFHSQLGPALTFGYGGAPYLGPTIVARRGQPIKLTATNNLAIHPLTALATPDPMNVMGVLATDATAPRASLHLHGSYTAPASDGDPMDDFPPGNSLVYTYPNDQQSATLWYHDHAFALTRANVYAGLAGYYLLRDEFDTGDPANNPIVNLPVGYGIYEIPLVIQDKSFNADGSLFYAPNSAWMPEFFGDVAVVNGKAWPNLNVQQAVYRFRIINGSQARFYDLSLSNRGAIYQIGTDSGLLDAPVALRSLAIGPGERADILVDFTRSTVNDKIVLRNIAPAPFPHGKKTARAGGVPLPEIMQFTVVAAAGAGAVVALPSSLRGNIGQPPLITRLSDHTASIVRQRNMVLFEVMGSDEPIASTINILGFETESLTGPNGISTGGGGAVIRDTLEQWNIINLTGDTHPMHVHLANFQVLNRQALNTHQYLEAMAAAGMRPWTAMGETVEVPDTRFEAVPDPAPYLSGPARTPAANEMGWKDTVHVPPGQVTRLLIPFGSQALGAGVPGIHFGQLVSAANIAPYNNPAEFNGAFTGTYVWHCHILDHEENDMMNDYQVV